MEFALATMTREQLAIQIYPVIIITPSLVLPGSLEGLIMAVIMEQTMIIITNYSQPAVLTSFISALNIIRMAQRHHYNRFWTGLMHY